MLFMQVFKIIKISILVVLFDKFIIVTFVLNKFILTLNFQILQIN